MVVPLLRRPLMTSRSFLAEWKQKKFRPEKPLPRDVAGVVKARRHESRLQRPQRKNPFTDFVLGWLCLGIPFFFADRHGHQRFDEESGFKNAGSMLVLGASVCLVVSAHSEHYFPQCNEYSLLQTAIILSASVTFLALPGLDNAARTAGFVAILASVASLASSVIALFRHQTEVHRIASRSGEGLLYAVSTVSIPLFIPPVFPQNSPVLSIPAH